MRAVGLVIALALATPAGASEQAEFPISNRAAFEAELRAAILANGDVIADALAGPQPAKSEMQQYIEDDLSLLESLTPELLAGRDLALFTADDCAECMAAARELKDLTDTYGLTFIQHDLSTPQAAAWAAQLGLDEAPFYVLPNMILRGHMPAVVLQKYLAKP
ncbi:disulfide bond formation protein DsbA [Sulfitobacter sp. S0837]|uniref:disulfide bond formation protein DsbA n=1 Tax=Sulfitobacter maritimus TaxID=2741719 RepID=UPI00158344B6|nr:disulfide bond formation protein DsbA [Sulfitobacter maritimus]NUH66308.1 disulfide bond formation protein DsbA [Sulfitobacter maritimus]